MTFGAEAQKKKTARSSLSLPGNLIGGVLSGVNTRSANGIDGAPFHALVVYRPDEADGDYSRERGF